ncbi:hypothetical protein BS17DRAFT_765916 [Gyrodon lividus]|nr:hypothetical protein BS17DRAFT_765916 [Gyrodon lividus]
MWIGLPPLCWRDARVARASDVKEDYWPTDQEGEEKLVDRGSVTEDAVPGVTEPLPPAVSRPELFLCPPPSTSLVLSELTKGGETDDSENQDNCNDHRPPKFVSAIPPVDRLDPPEDGSGPADYGFDPAL